MCGEQVLYVAHRCQDFFRQSAVLIGKLGLRQHLWEGRSDGVSDNRREDESLRIQHALTRAFRARLTCNLR